MSHPAPISRRSFLYILGGGAIVAAGTGLWAGTRDPVNARAPWAYDLQNTYPDPIRRALSYAILAPNPHNRQPWQVDLHDDTSATLYCQLDRRLPETDPFNRQITIGLGCFLELLSIAASQSGYQAQVTPFPQGEDPSSLDARPVAHIQLLANPALPQGSLFTAISARRTDRSAFDLSRPVPPAELAQLGLASGKETINTFISAPVTVQELRALSWQAWLIETDTPDKHLETINLTRIGRREIEATPDGISLSGALIEGLFTLGMISKEKMSDPQSAAFQQAREFMRPAISTAMAYGVIATKGNNRLDQLAAGKTYLRMALEAARLGISIHPLSQALQEYPEMTGPYARIHKRLAPAGETLQMFARLGYGAGAKPAPRWPLDTRIITH